MFLVRTLSLILIYQGAIACAAASPPKAPAPAPKIAAPMVEIDWYGNYAKAMKAAKSQHKMLFIWFQGRQATQAARQFESVSLKHPAVVKLLDRYIALKAPVDLQITVDGRSTKVLSHPAFEELHGQAGIAILDFAHPGAEHYGKVVTALPFSTGKYYRFQPHHLAVALDLPPGTITQRTLVFAVRIHPEKPASTIGQLDPNLAKEASNHSWRQARMRRQGHHNWGSRFPRLSALLPFGLRAQEVVAESWPHESLVDAAVDCVDSWRQSSGHWSAVRARQPRFGYDMQRGSNGIWYATGLFGNHR